MREVLFAASLPRDGENKKPAAADKGWGGDRRNALAAFVTRPQAEAQIGANVRQLNSAAANVKLFFAPGPDTEGIHNSLTIPN
jgi:hypothetical protein